MVCLALLSVVLACGAGAASPGQPAELGQTVNGYQDDFSSPTRNTDWVVRGAGGDHYVQTNGVLQVSVKAGDPNHLVYAPPGGYHSNVQEVLARLRVVAFGVNADPYRGGIAVGVTTNTAASPPPWNSQGGLNLELRDFASDGNEVSPQNQRKVKFLDDLRSWGPAGIQMTWMNNVWYWLRLRLAPKEDGTNSLFGKAWVADGQTPEPADWQIKWGTTSPALPSPLRYGYAGITGCSSDGLGQFEVDYILIKADGLPAITADWKPLGPPPNPLAFTTLTHNTNKVYMEFFGGVLQSAVTFTNPWTDVANGISPYAVTATAGSKKFYRLREQEIEFTALMTGDREVPPVSTPATGLAIFRLNANTLNYDIPYSGLTTNVTAAAIRGPASSTGNADVIIPLTGFTGMSGRKRGTVTVSNPDYRSYILAGQTYVNIVTTNNPDGEIRGQITPVLLRADLNGASEVPFVATPGQAQATLWLIGNELSWNLSYWDLSAPVTGAGIYDPVRNVLVALSGLSGTAGSVSGSVTITDNAYLGLIGDRLTYVNILTSAYPDGEVRGQIGW